MSVKKEQARIHVILAREAPFAVIFRRGPSDCAATIGWDLRNDTFTPGQWFKGRIYADRGDLSPDGKHLIYFAAKYSIPDKLAQLIDSLQKRGFGSFEPGDDWKHYLRVTALQRAAVEKKYKKELAKFSGSSDDSAPTWTAISRAPYLKATDLWFHGSTWGGGGLFTDNKKVWLDIPAPQQEYFREAFRSRRFKLERDAPSYGQCGGSYWCRLERDGWRWKRGDAPKTCLFEKELPQGGVLQKNFSAGCHELHRILAPDGSVAADGPDWGWADYDRKRERILFAQYGALWHLPLKKELPAPVMIRDLNDMRFEAVAAPY